MLDLLHDPQLIFSLDLSLHDGKTYITDGMYGHLCTSSGVTWSPRGGIFAGAGAITIADHPSFDTNTLTALVLTKGNVQNSKAAICRYDWGAGKRTWIIEPPNTNKMTVICSDDGTVNAGHFKQYTSSLVAFDNAWHLNGFTFTGGALTLYVDGVADANPTKMQDDNIKSLVTSTVPITLGDSLNNGASGGQVYTGTTKWAGAWGRVLYPHEINLFNDFIKRGL